MLDGTHFFECACGSDEHTLRFTLDKKDGEIFTSVHLNNWLPWYERLWRATKYVFGYKCRYGHWDCWIMRSEDAGKLMALLEELEPSNAKETLV